MDWVDDLIQTLQWEIILLSVGLTIGLMMGIRPCRECRGLFRTPWAWWEESCSYQDLTYCTMCRMKEQAEEWSRA